MYVCETGVGLFLIYLSILDCRHKKVPLLALVIGILFVLLYGLFVDHKSITTILLGSATGMFFILVGALTEKIGAGDGLVIIITGMIIGAYDNLVLLMLAFIGAIFYFLFSYFVIKRMIKSIPFIPFLMMGYLVYLFRLLI